MALVKDDVVKMDWESEHALYLKNPISPTGKMFVFAGKEYTNKLGKVIPVIFQVGLAYVWAENGDTTDLWSIKELKNWCKKNVDYSFPTGYMEYIPLVTGEGLNTTFLQELGLEEYSEDILHRLDDIAGYGVEVEQKIQ